MIADTGHAVCGQPTAGGGILLGSVYFYYYFTHSRVKMMPKPR